MLSVCYRCLQEIESREGRQTYTHNYTDPSDALGSKCDWCGESGFDELFVIPEETEDESGHNKTCFLLISIIDKELLTEQFPNLESAQSCIRDEMMRYCQTQFVSELHSVIKRKELWKSEDGYVDPSDHMGFWKYEAYMTDDFGVYNCEWRIIEIEM